MAGFTRFKKNISLIKIANGKKIKHVLCKPNKITLKALDLLWDNGLIEGYRFLKAAASSSLFVQVFLKYNKSHLVFQDLRVFSRRLKPYFFSWRMLSLFRKNFSLILISTPKGIFSLAECLQRKLGGIMLLICL